MFLSARCSRLEKLVSSDNTMPRTAHASAQVALLGLRIVWGLCMRSMLLGASSIRRWTLYSCIVSVLAYFCGQK